MSHHERNGKASKRVFGSGRSVTSTKCSVQSLGYKSLTKNNPALKRSIYQYRLSLFKEDEDF